MNGYRLVHYGNAVIAVLCGVNALARASFGDGQGFVLSLGAAWLFWALAGLIDDYGWKVDETDSAGDYGEAIR